MRPSLRKRKAVSYVVASDAESESDEELASDVESESDYIDAKSESDAEEVASDVESESVSYVVASDAESESDEEEELACNLMMRMRSLQDTAAGEFT